MTNSDQIENNNAQAQGITINNGNVQIVTNPKDSIIEQNNYMSNVKKRELYDLIKKVRMSIPNNMDQDDAQLVNDALDVISEETVKSSPKKSLLRNAISVLKGIVVSTEFTAAVVTLADFVKNLIV